MATSKESTPSLVTRGRFLRLLDDIHWDTPEFFFNDRIKFGESWDGL